MADIETIASIIKPTKGLTIRHLKLHNILNKTKYTFKDLRIDIMGDHVTYQYIQIKDVVTADRLKALDANYEKFQEYLYDYFTRSEVVVKETAQTIKHIKFSKPIMIYNKKLNRVQVDLKNIWNKIRRIYGFSYIHMKDLFSEYINRHFDYNITPNKIFAKAIYL